VLLIPGRDEYQRLHNTIVDDPGAGGGNARARTAMQVAPGLAGPMLPPPSSRVPAV
jgi:hypothetical protein